jgi:precorrin isomerase
MLRRLTVDDFVPHDAKITVYNDRNAVHVQVGDHHILATGLADLARHLAFQMGEVRRLREGVESAIRIIDEEVA